MQSLIRRVNVNENVDGDGLVVDPAYAFTQALPPMLAALHAVLAPEGRRGRFTIV
jgi:23S rRNA (adenine2030-N6)-methyltransferase